jgi:hypothetical protein
VGSRVDIRDDKYDWNVGLITNIVELNGVEHLIVKYHDTTRQF